MQVEVEQQDPNQAYFVLIILRMLAGGKKAIFGEQFFFLECDRWKEILVGPRTNKLVEKSSPAATFWPLKTFSFG